MTASAEGELTAYTGSTGCYCLCHVTHPDDTRECMAVSAITTRLVNEVYVQMCGPCADAYDARHAAAAPAEAEAEPGRAAEGPAGLAGQLGERAGAMPAEAGGTLRECIAALAGAWAGQLGDPAEALRVIEVNAACARRLLRPPRRRKDTAAEVAVPGPDTAAG